jgi:hypothetical protein
MSQEFMHQFRQRLEDNHSWPCTYMFKFIVPSQQREKVLGLFESRDFVYTRQSRNGRYLSVTAKCKVYSSEEVIAVYEAAAQIKGVLSL